MHTAVPFILLAASLPLLAEVKFRPQEIQADFGVVYAVTAADVNKDGKPDVVAINGNCAKADSLRSNDRGGNRRWPGPVRPHLRHVSDESGGA